MKTTRPQSWFIARNIDIRLRMLGHNLTWVATMLGVSKTAISNRLARTVNERSLRWWSTLLLLPDGALTSEDPTVIGRVRIPEGDGWERVVRRALTTGKTARVEALVAALTTTEN